MHTVYSTLHILCNCCDLRNLFLPFLKMSSKLALMPITLYTACCLRTSTKLLIVTLSGEFNRDSAINTMKAPARMIGHIFLHRSFIAKTKRNKVLEKLTAECDASTKTFSHPTSALIFSFSNVAPNQLTLTFRTQGPSKGHLLALFRTFSTCSC